MSKKDYSYIKNANIHHTVDDVDHKGHKITTKVMSHKNGGTYAHAFINGKPHGNAEMNTETAHGKARDHIDKKTSVNKSEGIDAQNEQNHKEMYNENPKPRSVTKFVAFNANNVSSKLVDHINANDHVGLSQASQNLHDAADVISSWVENARGTVVSRAADEIIAMVPEEALGSIEEVKANYKQLSGHDLTCGIGDSLADAANSLIGNKNGDEALEENDENDQIDEIDQEMDEVAEDIASDGSEDVDQDGVADSDEEHGEIDPEMDDANADGEVDHEEAMQDEQAPPEGDVAEEDFVEGEAAASEVEDQAGEEAAEEYSEEVPEMDDTQEVPEHEEGLNPEEKQIHDATESETDEQEIAEEQGSEIAQRDEQDSDMIEENMEQEQEMVDPAQEEMPPEGEEMAEGNLEPEEQELFDLLSQDLNDEPESATLHDAKARIVETLNNLKANKDSIEAMKSHDPEAYGTLIEFIRSMIDMAKQVRSEEGAEDMEAAPEDDTEGASSEMPPEGEEMAMPEETESDDDESEEEEEEVKKPQG